MGLLLVVLTPRELVGAVVHGSDSAEAVLVRLLHLLMPLGVADHLLLLGEHLEKMGSWLFTLSIKATM